MYPRSAEEHLRQEIERFRLWADTDAGLKSGEWEFYYPHWDDLYKATEATISSGVPTAETIQDLLYILARDNEAEIVLDI